jgi:hypothetical protein
LICGNCALEPIIRTTNIDEEGCQAQPFSIYPPSKFERQHIASIAELR